MVLNIIQNGLERQDMDQVNKFEKMEKNTLDYGKIINLMVTVFIIMIELYVQSYRRSQSNIYLVKISYTLHIEYNSQMMKNGKLIRQIEREILL
ncbi:unnamed protein product [Paramecium primaurelia]|uniref:Uncharacterized protein n=1 Tax=Paramecium primaurelia TaxID=5886 RepID=A0A8S1LGZ8_PARPR|nr:unnamed protein product [Paramecium primaurelia]